MEALVLPAGVAVHVVEDEAALQRFVVEARRSCLCALDAEWPPVTPLSQRRTATTTTTAAETTTTATVTSTTVVTTTTAPTITTNGRCCNWSGRTREHFCT